MWSKYQPKSSMHTRPQLHLCHPKWIPKIPKFQNSQNSKIPKIPNSKAQFEYKFLAIHMVTSPSERHRKRRWGGRRSQNFPTIQDGVETIKCKSRDARSRNVAHACIITATKNSIWPHRPLTRQLWQANLPILCLRSQKAIRNGCFAQWRQTPTSI